MRARYASVSERDEMTSDFIRTCRSEIVASAKAKGLTEDGLGGEEAKTRPAESAGASAAPTAPSVVACKRLRREKPDSAAESLCLPTLHLRNCRFSEITVMLGQEGIISSISRLTISICERQIARSGVSELEFPLNLQTSMTRHASKL